MANAASRLGSICAGRSSEPSRSILILRHCLAGARRNGSTIDINPGGRLSVGTVNRTITLLNPTFVTSPSPPPVIVEGELDLDNSEISSCAACTWVPLNDDTAAASAGYLCVQSS